MNLWLPEEKKFSVLFTRLSLSKESVVFIELALATVIISIEASDEIDLSYVVPRRPFCISSVHACNIKACGFILLV